VSIRVIKQGIADSIQDTGRYGYQQLGINPGGAMDTIAAQTANLLVGNHFSDAVIELHFPASSFLFNKQTLIALSGADFSASINDVSIPINTPVIIQKNNTLQFKQNKIGARCYMAVQDGFVIDKWLNSYSTNIKAKAGGFEGRYLLKQDEIDFRFTENYSNILHEKDCVLLPWHIDTKDLYSSGNSIRILSGKEFQLLDDVSKNNLQSTFFSISSQSDRMGYRMKGEALRLENYQELISTGVTKGTVQLLPDGQLIILMADHQTTGGYARAAHVISADIPKLAQMNANEKIQFRLIELNEAEHLLYQQQQHLLQLQNALNFRLKAYLQQHGLH